MQTASQAEAPYTILRSDGSGRSVTDALTGLFAGDGTIYLVVGYFTYNGYRSIRDDITGFLDRSPENELKIVVGTGSDQFSPRIAHDLRSFDNEDQIEILTYQRGLHAKLYLRDGPNPHLILTSANLTQVGFRYNLELGIEVRETQRNSPLIQPFLHWVSELIDRSRPVRQRDLLWPVQFWSTLINWSNKGRLLPRRYLAKRVTPVVLLMGMVALFVWFL